ncbi:MAG: hypothetical protein FWC40_02480, partial [Proteobacteria bacterium]|nr:hypothetical protein [Pseudomonadota bacterium]
MALMTCVDMGRVRIERHILVIAYRETLEASLGALSLNADLRTLIRGSLDLEGEAAAATRVVRQTEGGVGWISVILLSAKRHRHSPAHDVFGLRKLLNADLLGVKSLGVLVALGDDDPVHLSGMVAELARQMPTFWCKRQAPEACRVSCAFVTQMPLSAPARAEIEALFDSIQVCAALVDTPAQTLDCEEFSGRIREEADALGLTYDEIVGDHLRVGGFGGLYHVGKASCVAPRLLVVHYRAKGAKHRVSLVGKGIVYDTGGLCLKPRDAMSEMKGDMAGAAAVFGALLMAAKLALKVDMDAVFCLAENAIGPSAFRPDDIVTLYSGLNVEINNTDAEGRLVLGDGVAYASRHLEPDVIIDIATLTGAQLICTGKSYAGLLTSDAGLEAALVTAGKAVGEPVFPMLYAPDLLLGEFKSQVAD